MQTGFRNYRRVERNRRRREHAQKNSGQISRRRITAAKNRRHAMLLRGELTT